MITFNTAPQRIRIWICFCLLNNPTGWYVSPVQTAGRQTSKGEGERTLPQLWALSLQRTWSLEHHSYPQSLYQREKPQAATRLNGSLASKSGTKAKEPRWLLHNKIPSNTRRQSPQRPTSESRDSSGPLEYVPVNPPRETFTPAGSSHGPAGVWTRRAEFSLWRNTTWALLPVPACGSLPLIPIWERQPGLFQQLCKRGGAAWVAGAPECRKLRTLPTRDKRGAGTEPSSQARELRPDQQHWPSNIAINLRKHKRKLKLPWGPLRESEIKDQRKRTKGAVGVWKWLEEGHRVNWVKKKKRQWHLSTFREGSLAWTLKVVQKPQVRAQGWDLGLHAHHAIS